MAFVIWITGLPGSGKSSVASALKEEIPDSVILGMDEFRKIVTPDPVYSDEEREHVYRALVYTAKILHDLGHNVIIDATGHRKSWRRLARKLIPGYYEIYLKCPLALCMERERTRPDTHAAPAGIYEKGKAGRPVPGINVPYEEPCEPELIIDTEKETPEEAAGKIAGMIASFLKLKVKNQEVS
ncbi:MAG TPA: adenylyl-sulfate kinase [Nitrospirae bacterium]|nr:adenylyl-sulfate kinase [Nitrospirota bacterium]